MIQCGWRWLALLLCLVLLAGCTEAAPEATESSTPAPTPTAAPTPPTAETDAPPAETEAAEVQSLVLWLAEDAPLVEHLDALAAAFSAQHPETPLRIFRFSDAEELRRALAQGKPDLLLCSGGQAAALAAEGKLAANMDEEAALLLRPCFQSAPSGFFPLGGELPVLVVKEENRALLPASGSLEDFCAQAEGYARRYELPFFSVDSFTSLFAGTLAQKGSPFYAMREMDLESEAYREVYNMLAGSAFEGGLVSLDEAVLSAVERGDLVCGICSSRELLDDAAEDIVVLPLPPMAGCEALTESTLWGLAVPEGAQSGAADFLAWLYAQPAAAEAALDAGLLPAAGSDWEAAERFAAVLEGCRVCCSTEDSGFARNGTNFEQSFRAALALLG